MTRSKIAILSLLVTLLAAACIHGQSKPVQVNEEPAETADQKVDKQSQAQELADLKSQDQAVSAVLAAYADIHAAAVDYAKRQIETNPDGGLSLDEATIKRLKGSVARLKTSAELGLLAKWLWHGQAAYPNSYEYPVWMTFFFCAGALAERSDDEAEEILYDLYEHFANDGGAREMMNDILEDRESRIPKLNRGPLKDFKRDDLITTVPRSRQTTP